ncbi:MAG: O-antigen ligase family protein [Candidatus Sulfotelmatobacter sp.]|jgi:hypothetical protein
MIFVGVIDLVVVGVLVFIAFSRGLEAALPFFAFALVLLPNESQFQISGLFDFTTARIAIMVFTALYIFLRKKGSDTQTIRGMPLKSLMLLTIAWSIVATANSIVFTTSLKAVLSQTLDYYFVYYLFFKTITKPETVRRILLAIVSAMVVCCIFGFLEVYQGWGVINLFPPVQGRLGYDAGLLFDMERGLRVRATFPHAILFGGALALAIPLALYLLTVARSAGQKTFLWLAVLMMFWNIYKTASRGPWLGLVLAYTLFLFFSQARTRKHLLIIALLVISVLVIRPGVRETLENTYLATTDPDTPEGNSYAGRWDLIRIGTAALAKDAGREIWGYGPESFYYLHLETVNAEGHIAPSESCDDAWLNLAIETGYVGMLFVAALFLQALGMTVRRFFKEPEPAKYLYGLVFVNVVTFAFLMLSVAIYGWGQQTYLLWIPLALAMAYPGLAHQDSTHGRAPLVWDGLQVGWGGGSAAAVDEFERATLPGSVGAASQP